MQPPFPNDKGVVEPLFSQYAENRLLMSLSGMFVSGMKENLANIEIAINKGDFAAMARHCHKACGSAATYGFVELKDSLALLENGAQSHMPAIELKMLLRLVHHVAVRVFAGIET